MRQRRVAGSERRRRHVDEHPEAEVEEEAPELTFTLEEAEAWAEADLIASLHGPSQDSTHDRLTEYRSQIDMLTQDDVVWCPYGSYAEVIKAVPLTTYRGLIAYRHIFEPYMPDRCLRQLGFVQTIPGAPFAPRSQYRGSDARIRYRVGYSADQMEICWPQRYMCRLALEGHTPFWRSYSLMAADYMEWYYRHS